MKCVDRLLVGTTLVLQAKERKAKSGWVEGVGHDLKFIVSTA